MIVYEWTGIESKALRDAMNLTVEQFAQKLQVAARTVEGWESRGAETRLRPSSRQLLDRALTAAPKCVAARFERALGAPSERPDELDPPPPRTVTLANDTLRPLTAAALGDDEAADQVWLPARTAAGEVVLVSLPRRTVVTGIGVGALAAATGVLPAAALATSPDVDQVEHFHRLRLALIESDNLHGSSSVIPLMEQSIDRMGQLRRAGVGDPTAMQRMRVLYAEFTAWLHQNGRSWDRAQHWTDRALTWSHQLGDSYSIAATLIRKAQIANDQGDGAEAVELAEAAERAAPPNTRFAAVAAAFSGHGSALAGDRAASERAFDRARLLAEDVNADPRWGFFLDHAYIDVHQAHGRTALGDYRGAIDQFGAAISSMRSGYTRDQAVYVARQALAYARAGEPEPAAQLGIAAMRVGVSTGSERILYNSRALNELLDQASTQDDVLAFRDAGRRWAVLAS
ncbi:helix-turn-helix domain-containing protein [Nocardia brasiliensis]